MFAASGIFTQTAAAADVYIPEAPRDQKAVYDEATNSVIISATAPTMTEYDWDDWYEPQKELPYVSYVLIERHTPSTPWGDNPEVGRVENPALGETFTFVDSEVLPDSKYEYRLTCYVDYTKGTNSAYAQAYTGVIPGALQLFTATVPDAETTEVDITVTAPEMSAAGNPLSGTMSIDIMQYIDYSENVIHTIEDAVPGETYRWKHTGLTLDTPYHYRACARIGGTGSGERSSADTYVGLDYPGEPTDLVVTPESEGARLTWQHADHGYYGGFFDPEGTTYTIKRKYYDGTSETAATGIQGTEFFDNPGFEEARAVSYSILAINAKGEAFKETTHNSVSFGPAVRLPFTESFSYESLDHLGWTFETSQNDEYYTYEAWEFQKRGQMFYFPTDETLLIPAHDNDDGLATCLFYSYSEDGQTESLVSPAIDVTDINKVTFKFHRYEVSSQASMNVVSASISRDNGEWEELYRSEPVESADSEWKEVSLPVSLDDGCTAIKVRIDAIRHDGPITDVFIDDISVTSSESGVGNTLTDADNETPAEYYTIQGIRVNTPETPGVYLVKKRNDTTKVVINAR